MQQTSTLEKVQPQFSDHRQLETSLANAIGVDTGYPDKDFANYHGMLIGAIAQNISVVAKTGATLPKELISLFDRHINHLFNAENITLEQYHSGTSRKLSEIADQALQTTNADVKSDVRKQIAGLALKALEV
jgi:hypothetical protein